MWDLKYGDIIIISLVYAVSNIFQYVLCVGFHCNTSHSSIENKIKNRSQSMMSVIPKRQHREVFDQVYHEMLDKRNWQMRLEDKVKGRL